MDPAFVAPKLRLNYLMEKHEMEAAEAAVVVDVGAVVEEVGISLCIFLI